MMRLEHLRALELEAIKKEEVKAMNEQFKKDNAKQLEIIAELKLRDLAEDEKYRQLAIDELDKREKARNKMLQVRARGLCCFCVLSRCLESCERRENGSSKTDDTIHTP